MSASGSASPETLLESGLQVLRLAIPQGAAAKLFAYLGLLQKWNKAYNLTAVTDPHAAVTQHLLDSLAVLPHLPPGALADVGCGAGLPGIPIAIVQPERSVTLNDSNQKKIAFVRQVKIELDLPNLSLHAGRVEAWRPSPKFDVAISRAFAQLAEFLALSRGILRPGGWFAAMKGALSETELAGAPAGLRCKVLPLRVPHLCAERHLVLCQASA